MSETGRWVVLGVAHTRSPWFTEVARWSTMGSVPLEFVKCLAIDDLRARLRSGRRHSAALVDAHLTAVDRELLAELRAHGCAPLVVAAPTRPDDWMALGAAAVLDPGFGPVELVELLAETAPTIDRPDGPIPRRPTHGSGTDDQHRAEGSVAPLIAIVGHGGAGTSTVAAAVAQGLAARRALQAPVVLADLARTAHQGVLHDAGDIVPGLHEVTEAHRNGQPDPARVLDLTFDVSSRGYRLLLGLRRPQDWTVLRRSTVDAALATLRAATTAVVVDADADLDGEAETGSHDVEDLNLLARRATALADVVVAVVLPTVTGLHGTALLLRSLVDHGVPAERVVVVVDRAPLRPRARAQLVRTIAELASTGPTAAIGTRADAEPIRHEGPVFVPLRRAVEELHRSVGRFPDAMVDPPTTAVVELLARLGPRHPLGSADAEEQPVAIRPGELGQLGDEGWTTPSVPQHP